MHSSCTATSVAKKVRIEAYESWATSSGQATLAFRLRASRAITAGIQGTLQAARDRETGRGPSTCPCARAVPKLTVRVVFLLSPTAQHRYRNEVPQHHHRNSPSSRVGCGPCVLSGQHGCGCMKFGTKRPTNRLANGFANTSLAPGGHDRTHRPSTEHESIRGRTLGPLSKS